MINNFTRAMQEYEHKLSDPLEYECCIPNEVYLELQAEREIDEYYDFE